MRQALLQGSSQPRFGVVCSVRAAQPRLAEVYAAGEEEASCPGPDATLQQGPDLAWEGQVACPGKQGIFLAKYSGGADLYYRRP